MRWLGNWKTFHLVVFSQTSVVFVTPWYKTVWIYNHYINLHFIFLSTRLLHESISWLVQTGRAEKCGPIIKSIARANGVTLDPAVVDSFNVKMGKETYI